MPTQIIAPSQVGDQIVGTVQAGFGIANQALELGLRRRALQMEEQRLGAELKLNALETQLKQMQVGMQQQRDQFLRDNPDALKRFFDPGELDERRFQEGVRQSNRAYERGVTESDRAHKLDRRGADRSDALANESLLTSKQQREQDQAFFGKRMQEFDLSIAFKNLQNEAQGLSNEEKRILLPFAEQLAAGQVQQLYSRAHQMQAEADSLRASLNANPNSGQAVEQLLNVIKVLSSPDDADNRKMLVEKVLDALGLPKDQGTGEEEPGWFSSFFGGSAEEDYSGRPTTNVTQTPMGAIVTGTTQKRQGVSPASSRPKEKNASKITRKEIWVSPQGEQREFDLTEDTEEQYKENLRRLQANGYRRIK